jgi:hypothetical protein
MLEFSKLTLQDIEAIRKYFSYSTNNTCDNTVGGTFMWRDYFSMEYALFNDTLVLKLKVEYRDIINGVAFYLPLGKDRNGAIQKIEEYCNNFNIPVIFCFVTGEELPFLSSFYEKVQLHQDSDWSDYVYFPQDIVTLAGRKYHGQRNHINSFKKAYSSYLYEGISESNIKETAEFYDTLTHSINKNSAVSIEEKVKTLEVLNNYNAYGLIGGLIRVNGAVAAFSIGEIRDGTLFIHIEKADLKYKGIYPVINNEFARFYVTSDIELVNRGEDVGDEGLRTSKKSYHPCLLIDKFFVLCSSFNT